MCYVVPKESQRIKPLTSYHIGWKISTQQQIGCGTHIVVINGGSNIIKSKLRF